MRDKRAPGLLASRDRGPLMCCTLRVSQLPPKLPPDDEIGPWLRFLPGSGRMASPHRAFSRPWAPGRLLSRRERECALISVIDCLILGRYGVFSGKAVSFLGLEWAFSRNGVQTASVHQRENVVS